MGAIILKPWVEGVDQCDIDFGIIEIVLYMVMKAKIKDY